MDFLNNIFNSIGAGVDAIGEQIDGLFDWFEYIGNQITWLISLMEGYVAFSSIALFIILILCANMLSQMKELKKQMATLRMELFPETKKEIAEE